VDADLDTPPAATALQPGDRVLHRIFGAGTVLKILAAKDSTTVEVLFDRGARKTLDLAFANLQRVG
jgi:DNA helicase-2/ATP-dependent DNA helicase PcrA